MAQLKLLSISSYQRRKTVIIISGKPLRSALPPPDVKNLKKMAALFQLKQKPHQTVVVFVLLIQAEARGLRLSEENLVFVIIQGLQPKIKNYIKMSDPSSVHELL